MYELVILSLLMRIPLHGYLIAKIINDLIGPYAKMSNGRLYPLLAKLEQQGYISSTINKKNDRPSKIYTITDIGKKRFHILMMDTTSNPSSYKELFLLKISVFEFLKPEEKLLLINHYIQFCKTHIFHLTTEEKDTDKWSMNPEQIHEILERMDHMIKKWRLELKWAMQLREKELIKQN